MYTGELKNKVLKLIKANPGITRKELLRRVPGKSASRIQDAVQYLRKNDKTNIVCENGGYTIKPGEYKIVGWTNKRKSACKKKSISVIGIDIQNKILENLVDDSEALSRFILSPSFNSTSSKQ